MNSNNKIKRALAGGAGKILCNVCGRSIAPQGMPSHMASMHNGLRTMGAMSNVLLGNNKFAYPPAAGVSQNVGRRRNRTARMLGMNGAGRYRGMGMPMTNTDGTLRQPNQALEEHLFGSSSAEHIPGSMVPATTGLKQAVASVMGSTPTGKAWALAALHPCGSGEVISSSVGDVVGMCDTMTGSVATPVLRGESHIPYNKALFPNPDLPNLGSTSYGVDLIIPPVPEIDFIYRLRDDATNVKTPWVCVRQQDYDLPVYKQDGTVYGYDPSVLGTTFASSGYGKMRIIAMGHTIELDAADLANQGRVVVGQMEGQWRELQLGAPAIRAKTGEFVTAVGPPVVTGTALTSVAPLGPDDTGQVWLLNVPTDPQVITANCPGAYQGLAKHGAYVVSKFTSPLLGYEFKRTAGESVFDTGTQAPTTSPDERPYLPQSGFAINSSGRVTGETLSAVDDFYVGNDALRSGFGTGQFPLRSSMMTDATIERAAIAPFTSEPSDMMTAVVLFRNLPATATNGLTASLRIKSRTYFEAISNGSNPAVAPYIHPPAQFDFPALNSVIVAGKQLADAYPACANSLGSILGKIWSALKGTSAIVGGLGLPFISDFGKTAGTVFKGVDDLIGMF